MNAALKAGIVVTLVTFAILTIGIIVLNVLPSLGAEASTSTNTNTNANSSATQNGQSTTPSASSGRCIITVLGTKYDVTDFRNIHSGGDVFVCGTDMTNTFLAHHPQSMLSLMQQYIVK